MIKEQEKLLKELSTVINIFINSECEIRPHFVLTGGSGTGKSHSIQTLAAEHGIGFVEINGAQLTKEGTAGNSLSKALAPLGNLQGAPDQRIGVEVIHKETGIKAECSLFKLKTQNMRGALTLLGNKLEEFYANSHK